MSAARMLTSVIAATLPWGVRERYREEWQADLDGAATLDIPVGVVVRGAAVTALTLDRTDPATSGMPRSDLARRRGRWAAAFGSSAVVLGFGMLINGGLRSVEREQVAGGSAVDMVGTGLEIAAVVLGAIALVFALGALAVGGIRITLIASLILALLGVGAVATVLIVMPMILIVAVPFAGFFALIALSRGSQPPASRRVRAAWGTVFTVAALGFIAIRVAQITVWNPLARAPGLTLDQIYAEMVAAGQLSPGSAIFVAIWAAVWVAIALGLLVVCLVPAAGSGLTLRRLVATGCAMLGLITATSWIAGFGIGMALADTFMTSGGDGTLAGAALTIVGQLALAAALIVGLAPSRPTAAEPAPVR